MRAMRTKTFTCSECGEKCTSKIKLGEHVKQHAKTSTTNKLGKNGLAKRKVEHKCSTCEAIFTSLALLKKHKSSCGAAPKVKPVKKRKSAFAEASPVGASKCINSGQKAADGNLLKDQVCDSLIESQSCLDTNCDVQDSAKVQEDLSATKSSDSSRSSVNLRMAGTLGGTGDIKNMSLALAKSMSNVKNKVSKEVTKAKSAPQITLTASRVNTRKTASPKNLRSQIKKNEVALVHRTRQRKAVQSKPKSSSKVAENGGKHDLKKFREQNEHSDISHDIIEKPSELLSGQDVSSVPVSQTQPAGRSRRKAPVEKKAPSSRKIKKTKALPKSSAKKESQRNPSRVETSVNEIISMLVTDEAEDDGDNEQIDDPQSITQTDSAEKNKDAVPSNQSKSDELNHVNEKSPAGEPKYSCAVCSKVFSKRYHLDRHLKLSRCSGLPPQTFPCQMCSRVYSRKDNLRQHLRAHTGEIKRKKNHKCGFCDKAFHGQSLLMIHLRKHTGEKPFACDFCPKRFPSAGALSKHRRTHTGEKPFECTECGQRFSLKGTLNRHLRVHSGIRPHVCAYCGKQFIQIGGLKAHLFYHTGENGFKCEDCGKVFNRKARLQMHKLFVHEKHRPFTCDHCQKSFTRKEDLSRHVILHTGEKPFRCPTCDKSFAIKPSLKLHLLTHTKEEPRSCHECGRAFIRKDCFLRHMRKRHRDLLDKLLVDEKDDTIPEPKGINSRLRSEEDLCQNIQELLGLLVDKITLSGLGWPDKPIDDVLEAVIKRCGHTPVDPSQYSYLDRMRENAKLLFTVVIDDNAVKTLLNNLTVDEVILHVLRLAKT